MTVVNATWDTTYPTQNVPPHLIGADPGPYYQGKIRHRDTSGTDRNAADKAAGRYPDHPYSGSGFTKTAGFYQHTTEDSNTHVLKRRYYVGGMHLDSYDSLMIPPGAWDSNDELVVLGRLAGKIRQHDWNAGIFIGELGKTVDTVADRARQFARALLAAKQGRFYDVAHILAAKPDRKSLRAAEQRRKVKIYGASDTARFGRNNWYSSWLEMRYAWRPVIKDIYDLSEAIRTMDVPREQVIRASYKKKRPFIKSTPLKWTFVVTGEAATRCSYKATLVEQLVTFPDHLGLNNPESVIWELVPYSFVADWFIPIGSYLATRNTLAKIDGTYVRTLFGYSRSSLDSVYYWSDDPGNNLSIKTGKSVLKIDRMNIARTVNNSLTIPLPTFRNPIGANPGTRLLDAVALISARVKG